MKKNNVTMIPIYVMGKKFDVPEDLTILKALEFSGFKDYPGCGCRGGFVARVPRLYRKKGDYRVLTGLACQTVIEPEINLVQLPFISARKALYAVRDIDTDSLDISEDLPRTDALHGVQYMHEVLPGEYLRHGLHIRRNTRRPGGSCRAVDRMCHVRTVCGSMSGRDNPIQYRPVYSPYLRDNLPKSPQLEQRLKDIENGVYKKEIEQLKVTM